MATTNQIAAIFFDIGGTLGEYDPVAEKIIPYPSSALLLETMHDVLGLRVGLITTLGSALTNGAALQLLNQAGLDTFLDPVAFVSDHDAGVAKPHAAIYQYAAHRVDLPLDRCLYVGESLPEVQGAIAAGMKAVLKPSPSGNGLTTSVSPPEAHALRPTPEAAIARFMGGTSPRRANPMSDPTTVIRAIEPAIHNALTTDGKPIAALVGSGVMSIEYHILDFSESQNPPNPNWVSRSQTITPPTGWQNVSVSVAMWNFDFYPQERPITYLGARAGVVVVGSTLQITAYAICRDSNADDAWRGSITLQVIFLG